MYEIGKKLSKPNTQNIRNPFTLKKKKEELKSEKLEIIGHFMKQKKKEK